MILSILNILLILTIKIIYDYKQWLNKKSIHHTLEWVLMVVGMSWAIYKLSTQMNSGLVVNLGIASGMVAFFMWNMFDGIYNKLRGYNWWFTGSNDGDDAKTDNFLQSLSPLMQKVVKIGGLALFTTLYIIL